MHNTASSQSESESESSESSSEGSNGSNPFLKVCVNDSSSAWATRHTFQSRRSGQPSSCVSTARPNWMDFGLKPRHASDQRRKAWDGHVTQLLRMELCATQAPKTNLKIGERDKSHQEALRRNTGSSLHQFPPQHYQSRQRLGSRC